MKKRVCRAGGLFALPVLAVAIVMAILTTVVLSNDYDTTIRHFTASTPRLLAAFAPLAAGLILTVIAGILPEKKPLPERISFSGAFPTFAAAFFAFLLVASAVFDFINADAVLAAEPAIRVGTYAAMLRVRAVLSVLTAPYFVLVVLGEKPWQKPAARFSSLPMIVWAIISTICQYFDGRMPINDPVKSLITLFSVGLIALSVGENRLRFRRGSYKLTAALLTFAAVLGGIAASALFFAIRESVSGGANVFGFTVMEATLYVAAVIFAFARLASLGETLDPKPEEQPHEN